MSGPTMTGYPPTGAWFYPQPAWRCEAHLHRVRGYHVNAVECELVVDADCGLSLTAATAVHVSNPGAADLLCGRCRNVGRGLKRARRARPRIRPRPVIARADEGSR